MKNVIKQGNEKETVNITVREIKITKLQYQRMSKDAEKLTNSVTWTNSNSREQRKEEMKSRTGNA